MNTISITRAELYRQVWSEPMLRLAQGYGISDVGMAKICRKHNIPRPPRGYWAKKEFGKAPPQTPLPEPENNYEIKLQDWKQQRQLSPELEQADAAEKRIEVAENLRSAHELVRQGREQLESADVDPNGLLSLPENSVLDCRVSKASLRRALLITDALLKACEQRGYSVAPGPRVTILDIEVRIAIEEQLETVREQPAEHDLDGPYRFGHSRFDVRRQPSGRLVLWIPDSQQYWTANTRQRWRDGKKQRLEDRLNSFVAGMVEVAVQTKEYQTAEQRREQAWKAEQLRRQEEARLRAEKRACIRAERALVDALLQQAQDWQQSQIVRSYLEAVKQKHVAEHGVVVPGSEFAQWLEWARRQADRLDPLVPNPPSILDEDLGDEEDREQSRSRFWWKA